MAYSSATELEKLLSNCEFENKQYVKLIEHEDQLIESLTKETEFKEAEIKRLQEAVSQLDEDTKQCHKQYTLNRDNLESLKKTNHVLTEHAAAMGSKMEILQHKVEAERQEHNCHLQRYRDIWATYHDHYESLPLALELKRQVMMIADLSKNNQETEDAIQNAKQKIEQLQGQDKAYKMGITTFVIALAKMRQETFEIKQEIEKKRCELNQVKTLTQQSKQNDNETTLQKLTDMHLVDKDSTEERCESTQSNNKEKLLETQSPMISMLCDRDDESEAMQTDVISHDQIDLQFAEENMIHHSKTSDTEHIQEDDIFANSNKPSLLDEENEEKTCKMAHTEEQNNPEECELSTSSGSPSNTHLTVSGMQSISQHAQLPFVAYKTKGPESVHIHFDKQQQQVPKLQDKSAEQQPQSDTTNQPTLRHNLISNQRPAILQPYDKTNCRSPFPGYRPHIPQVMIRSTSLLRQSTPSPRPNVSLNRSSDQPSPVVQAKHSVPQLYVPLSNMVQRSHLARPQQSPVPRSFHNFPVVQSPRHTVGPSRLQVLQSVRSPVSQQQRTPQLSMPSRLSDKHSPRLAQASISTRVQSPLQLTSPQVRLQSPQVARHSPLQLPSSYQNVVQHKTGPQNPSSSPSSAGSEMQIRSSEETSNEASQTQTVTKASPDTNQTERNIHPNILKETTVPVSTSSESASPHIDVKLPQLDDTSTYYMKVKDTCENSDESSSLDKSPGKPATPEAVDSSLAEETFSPFDQEKHLQKLADMKKSPAHPNFYPVKRAFAEMEGNCRDAGNENMQIPLFGQAESLMTTPFDGSGDPTNAGNNKGQNNDETTKPIDDIISDTENQSAFNLFGVFGSSSDASGCKSPGNLFSFGGGDTAKTGSPGFSLFGSTNIGNDTPSGFNFSFGDNSSVKQGNQPGSPEGGNFLSMFGDGENEDKDSSSTGFSFNFCSDQSTTPSFSFF